jgi:transcriptional regulator with XRE-family HTH domain
VEAVKRIRQEQGLSQQALAKKADVNKVTLIRIESGKGNPNIETLEKLADALGVELSDFFPKAQASLFQPEEEQRRDETPLEVAHNAAVEQARQDAQAIARARESGEPQISMVSAENEAADSLGRKFKNHDLAVALVDMARRYVHVEQRNAELEQRNAELKASLNELQDLQGLERT